MKLGVVVIARNIAGNTAVVTDMNTGLIYGTPQVGLFSCKVNVDMLCISASLLCLCALLHCFITSAKEAMFLSLSVC